MSEPKRDDEPTMEEILASIRKIISEDEPESAEAAPEAAESAAGGAEPEPMELTQMVSEDGSVVDLRSDQASEPAPPQESEAVAAAAPEPLVPETTRVHAELIGDDDGIELEAQETEVTTEEVEAEIVAEPEPEPEPIAEFEPEPEPEPEIVVESAPDIAHVPEPEPEPVQSAPAEPDSRLESLVSAEAAAAATAAMTRLNDSLSSESEAGGNDKTLEALVRETMAPHLKAWLDENLPRLVERIVREEIDRIVRRGGIR